MIPSTENRAVTAMFRVFGDAEPATGGEATVRTATRPMHEGERGVLAILVPLTVFAAAWDLCGGRWLGMAAIGLTLLALNVLPLALGGSTPTAHWRLWLAAIGLWAAFHTAAAGWVGWIARVWIGVLAIEFAAATFLGWHRLMALPGNPGLAVRLALFITAHLGAVAVGFLAGWPWALGAGACIAAWCCRAVLAPSCTWLGPVVTRTNDGPLITIDDGPDPHDTPRALDLLERHQRKAIFFLIGTKAAAHPDLVREIVRRGHEIGNHTMTHPQASFWCAGPSRTRREIAECQRLLREITGTAPRWFRAPVGHRNLFTHPVAAELGLEVMAWSRRGYDAVETDPQKVLARLTTPGIRTTDILLLHESTPIATPVLTSVLDSLITDHSTKKK